MSKDYGEHRDDQAGISRERSARGREIGPLPAVLDPDRRQSCRLDLQRFLRTYLQARFYLPFASIHTNATETMQRCLLRGGRFAKAMMRGGGKTTIAEGAVLWAVLYGHRRFVVLIQATEKHATRSLKKVRSELEFNDVLAEDFPEVCYPIRRLERINQRSKGQTLNGEPTRMEWTAESVILPAVPGSPSSGSILYVAGITGAIKGLSMSAPTGEILRPDVALIDDAQTRESAKSPTQTSEREAIIAEDILGLAGPTTEIAAINLCTPVYPGDLCERFLDPKRHPEWQGSRTRMLESMPARMDLWDQYAEIRRESLRGGDEGKQATEFYRENREAMDAAAVVAWPERMKPGELSGLQSAMNLMIDNPRGFKAEYQCEPESPAISERTKELAPASVIERLSRLPQIEVPRESTRLTCMIDVGGEVHWYAIVAWNAAFGGSVIDYGTWPRQNRSVFEASDPRPGLSILYPSLSEEERVYVGLKDLAGEILGRVYRREGTGEELRVERCLIDAGWQSQTVYLFCRQSLFANVIYPSKGVGRTSMSRGISEWKPRPGERSGWHWRLTISETGRGRMVQFDPDMWKTFLHERLTSPMGAAAITFYGQDAYRHEMIGEHCAAETGEPVTLRGTTFDKWAVRPHRPDNHWWDCLVGAAVAAGVQGSTFSAAVAAGDPNGTEPVKGRRVSYEETQARKAGSPEPVKGRRVSYEESQARKLGRG